MHAVARLGDWHGVSVETVELLVTKPDKVIKCDSAV